MNSVMDFTSSQPIRPKKDRNGTGGFVSNFEWKNLAAVLATHLTRTMGMFCGVLNQTHVANFHSAFGQLFWFSGKCVFVQKVLHNVLLYPKYIPEGSTFWPNGFTRGSLWGSIFKSRVVNTNNKRCRWYWLNWLRRSRSFSAGKICTQWSIPVSTFCGAELQSSGTAVICSCWHVSTWQVPPWYAWRHLKTWTHDRLLYIGGNIALSKYLVHLVRQCLYQVGTPNLSFTV